MNFYQLFILNTAISIAQSFVKNPKSIEKERALIVKLRDLLDQILEGVPAAG